MDRAPEPPVSSVTREGASRGSLIARLFQPTDGASLAIFRIGYGLILLWECYRFVDHGWIARHYIDPAFHFPYPFFYWVQPWPGNGMYYHFIVLAIASLLVAIGLFYRAAAAVVFVAFTYIFLLEEARYLNHFYLISLLSAVMIFLPAHRCFSVDAKLRGWAKSPVIPSWCLFLARFMIGMPYFFGGIAKLNGDWLRGQPIGMWLQKHSDVAIIGPLFEKEFTGYFFAYSGMMLDLLAAPLLCWSRTRPFMMILMFAFNFTNDRIFSIGIFPWFMIVATTIFFPADWPRRLAQDIYVAPTRQGNGAHIAGAICGAIAALSVDADRSLVAFVCTALTVSLVYWTLAERLRRREEGASRLSALWQPSELQPMVVTQSETQPAVLGIRSAFVVGLLFLWIAVHVLLPFRHLLIPGNVNWTEEGHRFAWHMKLRDKKAKTTFFAVDPDTNERWPIQHNDYLESWQYRKMSTRPYMIHQFAKHLRDELEADGHKDVEIYVDSRVSLNGRPRHVLIDPDVNLAAEPIVYWRSDWIVPLPSSPPGRN